MDPAATLLVTFGALLLLAPLAAVLGRRTHVPSVTLLLLMGLAIGPVGLDVLSEQRSEWFPLLATVSLSMIGFLLGQEFTAKNLHEHGREVFVVSLTVTVVTAVVVVAGLLLAGLPLTVALLLGGIATATAPAATLAVVRESEAEGPFTRSLLGIVAVDDVWGISLFAVLLAAAANLSGEVEGGSFLLSGARELVGGIALGAGLGLPMAKLTGRLQPGEPTRVEALGFVLLCGGLGTWLDVSFLLAAVTMGAVVAVFAKHHERPFHEIDDLDRPFLVLFFVLAGASLELESLGAVGGAAAAYVVLRAGARWLGGSLGGRLAGSSPEVRRYMGLALLPQAGVALGMALLVQQRMPIAGARVLPLVIVATVAFELLGPPCTRWVLGRVGEAGRGAGPEPGSSES